MLEERKQISALTQKFHGISRVIVSPVTIQNTMSLETQDTYGLWDTGATGSVITKSLAKKLNLIQISTTNVNGVHGLKTGIPVYAIKITLNNKNVSFVIPVTECEQLTDDNMAECLIGMDIISKGDFTITNANDVTVMTYRYPSVQTVDYVAEIKGHTPITSAKTPGRNAPCSCGSGKKYKNCCGK